MYSIKSLSYKGESAICLTIEYSGEKQSAFSTYLIFEKGATALQQTYILTEKGAMINGSNVTAFQHTLLL